MRCPNLFYCIGLINRSKIKLYIGKRLGWNLFPEDGKQGIVTHA